MPKLKVDDAGGGGVRALALMLLIGSAMLPLTPANAQTTSSAAATKKSDIPVVTLVPSKAPTRAEVIKRDIALSQYADCLVRSRQKLVVRYLRLPMAHPEASSIGKELVVPTCLLGSPIFQGEGGTMRMAMPAMRNGLYPALYRRAHRRDVPDLSRKPAPRVSDEWDVAPNPVSQQWLVRRALGDCVVRAQTEAAHRFVVSDPWTKGETDALPKLSQGLRECLPEGETLNLGREDLRGMLGEALYKLSLLPDAPEDTNAP